MINGLKNIEDIFKNNPIILFDGVCNLCDNSVQFVIKKDTKNVFKFAALQSDIIQKYLIKVKPELLNIDSILLLTNKKIYTKSSAALTIAKHLGGFYPLLYIFYFIPKPIRDIVYDYIAKNRYMWYGKKDNCMIPSPAFKNKFL